MASNPCTTCRSCGEPRSGLYCSACGEKAFERTDLSLRAFLAQLLDGLFSLDSKIFRTLGTLLARPGQLSRDVVEGRRNPYYRPIQIFLLANFVYFLTPTSPNTFNTSFNTQMNGLMTSSIARSMVLDPIRERHAGIEDDSARQAAIDADVEAYALEYSRRFPRLSQLLVLLMTPALALVLWALHPRGRYFAEHLIFAVHYFAFLLVLVILSGPFLHLLAFLLGPERWRLGVQNLIFEAIMGLILFFYLWRAAVRFYQLGPWSEALRITFGMFGLLLILQLYRFGVFTFVHLSM